MMTGVWSQLGYACLHGHSTGITTFALHSSGYQGHSAVCKVLNRKQRTAELQGLNLQEEDRHVDKNLLEELRRKTRDSAQLDVSI